MTIEQFDTIDFTAGIRVLFEGNVYDLAGINFPERLIGIQEIEDEDEIEWKRCENVELVP